MKTVDQWANEFIKSGKKAVLVALKSTMEDQLDKIGFRAGRTFHTSGLTKSDGKFGDRTGFRYGGKKNTSGRLRIRTGDLKRSIEARGGKRDNSIREFMVKRGVVTANIGSELEYASIHEFGNFPFLIPARDKEQSKFYSRFDKHWQKAKI